MIVVFFGDVFGRPGRFAVAASLEKIKQDFTPDFLVANVENLAGGRGINKRTYKEMMSLGFHALTSGNHVWDNKDIYSIFQDPECRVIRPLNYPSTEKNRCPGNGFITVESNGKKLTIVNVMGRLFMDQVDCPFQKIDAYLDSANGAHPILVDMHADATSEKAAMGWFLDGRVAGVVGTHSHVQTADERLLPSGTAYITDVGMNGAFDSVIGLSKDEVVRRFLTKQKISAPAAKENPGVSFVVMEFNDEGQKAVRIERRRYSVQDVSLSTEKDME